MAKNGVFGQNDQKSIFGQNLKKSIFSEKFFFEHFFKKSFWSLSIIFFCVDWLQKRPKQTFLRKVVQYSYFLAIFDNDFGHNRDFSGFFDKKIGISQPRKIISAQILWKRGFSRDYTFWYVFSAFEHL